MCNNDYPLPDTERYVRVRMHDNDGPLLYYMQGPSCVRHCCQERVWVFAKDAIMMTLYQITGSGCSIQVKIQGLTFCVDRLVYTRGGGEGREGRGGRGSTKIDKICYLFLTQWLAGP